MGPETTVATATRTPTYGGARVVRRAPGTRCHVLTVALEDYIHGVALKRCLRRTEWDRFERRIEASTRRALDLLAAAGARATFFVAGSVAEAVPELLRDVAARGHEVASAGYDYADLGSLGPKGFRDDAQRARSAIERATGRRVLGFRLGAGWIGPRELWILDALAETGHVYDSSLRPLLRAFGRSRWRRLPHRSHGSAASPREMGLLEVPIPSARVLGLDLPIAGGGYVRHLPGFVATALVRQWQQHHRDPYVAYFRVWELDAEQPRVEAGPALARIRQYRNLEQMPVRLGRYLTAYRFTSIADYFGLDAGPAAPTPPWRRAAKPVSLSGPSPDFARLPVTVVVPCYDESASLRYLANTLRAVEKEFGAKYTFTFVFVDDGSTDDTWPRLQRLFGTAPNCVLVQHARNLGIAAAIRTGIEQAKTEVVCSIDCDCTYDPLELDGMIARLTDGVDVVTASPYHPAGRVRDVPGWRLVLSRMLSRLYRLVMRQKLHTYTSCFRVYRRSTSIGLGLTRGDFLGVTEMLVRHDLAGHRIVEHPATLTGRRLGRSKMKLARTIIGHVGLLAGVAGAKLARAARASGGR